MTITYMTQPVNKLTLGATELENTLTYAKINRLENGYDTAIIMLPSTAYYPSTVTQGTTVLLEVKNKSDVNYTVLFAGTVRYVIADIADENSLTLACNSIGAGLSEMLVASDYGAQSENGLDSILEILTDSTDGIIPNYVEKILGGSASNYAYDTSLVTDLAGAIPYINFPYKPADKCLTDICDLLTALGAGSTAGPHWIITYDKTTGYNYLRLKKVDGTQTGWTKYYGNSQANATLTYGVDYTNINLEKMSAESNYIVYYGAWRRPSNGDSWTGVYSDWSAVTGSVANETTHYIVGSNSIKGYTGANPTGSITLKYPGSGGAGWNFDSFSEFNVPSLNFYVYYDLTNDTHLIVKLCKDDSNYQQLTNYNSGTPLEYIVAPNQAWQHYKIKIGPYHRSTEKQTGDQLYWTEHGTCGWSDINYIIFYVNAAEMYNSGSNRYLFAIDGLHFGDASVCRVAALSDYTGIITKQRIIVDDIGKDDSLIASDDSGLMAQMAYFELLRGLSTAAAGTVTTPMIKDILPGQWLYIQSTDYRSTKIEQIIDENGYKSNISITDDVLNGRSRPRYEDTNKVFGAIRPEWQDRQASNIKAGSVDWRITRLVKTY